MFRSLLSVPLRQRSSLWLQCHFHVAQKYQEVWQSPWQLWSGPDKPLGEIILQEAETQFVVRLSFLWTFCRSCLKAASSFISALTSYFLFKYLLYSSKLFFARYFLEYCRKIKLLFTRRNKIVSWHGLTKRNNIGACWRLSIVRGGGGRSVLMISTSLKCSIYAFPADSLLEWSFGLGHC